MTARIPGLLRGALAAGFCMGIVLAPAAIAEPADNDPAGSNTGGPAGSSTGGAGSAPTDANVSATADSEARAWQQSEARVTAAAADTNKKLRAAIDKKRADAEAKGAEGAAEAAQADAAQEIADATAQLAADNVALQQIVAADEAREFAAITDPSKAADLLATTDNRDGVMADMSTQIDKISEAGTRLQTAGETGSITEGVDQILNSQGAVTDVMNKEAEAKRQLAEAALGPPADIDEFLGRPVQEINEDFDAIDYGPFNYEALLAKLQEQQEQELMQSQRDALEQYSDAENDAATSIANSMGF